MEFLRSFLRRHIAGKLVTEWWRREINTISQATIFHPRIKPVLQQIRLLQVAESYCRTLQQNVYIMRFVSTQESEVTPPIYRLGQFW